MSISALIVAIVAALIGAGAGAGVTDFFGRRREKRARDAEVARDRRERAGLHKLVHAEIVNNLEFLKGMGNYSGTWFGRGGEKLKRGPDSMRVVQLKSEAWEQGRTGLAALIEDEERFKFLVSCYASLDKLRAYLTNPDLDNLSDEEYKNLVKTVINHHWLAFDVCHKETGEYLAWSKNGMLIIEKTKKIESLSNQEESASIHQPSE